MRKLALRDVLAKNNAQFGERFGAEAALSFSGREHEYRHVRDHVGVTDFSYMQRFRVPEGTGLDFLDGLVAGNVAKIRYGRVLHTFLADESGSLMPDCYIANNDEELLLFCESLADDSSLRAVLDKHGAGQAKLEDLTESHVLLGVDGYQAWSVVKGLFGADVLGLPYLSVEVYPFEGSEVRLIRAGKTSEFGYLLMAPVAAGAALLDTLHLSAVKHGGGLCGTAIHGDLRLEGRFFNIFAEGAAVRDPLALGLQWMIDFDKDAFIGRDAILQRRQAGLTHKIVGVAAREGAPELRIGSLIYDGATAVAEEVAASYSQVLRCALGLALFPAALAYTGLRFTLDGSGGPGIRTISMPPIMPKSLTVKLDEM